MTTLFAIFAAILLLNLAALVLGRCRGGVLGRVCTACGASGLVASCAFAIAALDALSQVWVKRAGYEGMPVRVSMIVLAIATLASLACLSVAAVQSARARRAVRHAIS